MVLRALTNVEEGLLSVGVGWTVVARAVGGAGVGCASGGVCMVSFVERLAFWMKYFNVLQSLEWCPAPCHRQ